MEQRFELLLRPDHVLEGGPEFSGQTSMGDNDDADHRVMHIPVRASAGSDGIASSATACPRRRMMIEPALARQAERGGYP